MRRTIVAAGVGCAALCGLSRAAEPDVAAVAKEAAAEENNPADENSQDDDAQDLLFLGPLRPVMIRLHVNVNQRPFRQAWRGNIEKLFRTADVNGDRAIDMIEPPAPTDGKQLAKPAEIDSLANHAAAYLGKEATQAKNALRQLAGEQGGRLSQSALVEFFARVAPPLTVAANNGNLSRARSGLAPAPALFPLLDANGDQQLTADELAAAELRLANRDFNEDEVLSPRELMVAPDASLAAAAAPAEASAPSILPGAAPVYLLNPDVDRKLACELIASRYDRDGDGRASFGVAGAGEIQLSDAQRARAKLGGEGVLDQAATTALFLQQPDLELSVSIGSVSVQERLATLRKRRTPRAEAEPADVLPRVKFHRGEKFELYFGDAVIDLYRNNRDPSQNNADGPRVQNFDADNNGYLDANELAGNPELAAAFAAIDVDGDGKIFGAEFNAYSDRQTRAAASRLLLEVADGGQQLLHVLDSDPDSVLSVRELRGAAAALEKSDVNRDGRLAGNEIPQRLALELSRNTTAGAQAANQRMPKDESERGEAAPAGPAWFQKLDRNRDGDVSRREFVGPAEIFDRLDADRDGLIDSREAERAAPAQSK